MSQQRLTRGPSLPYKVLAGVEPCSDGWLVVSAKLLGVSMLAEPPQVLPTLLDVLDYRPAFSFIALHTAVGLLDATLAGGRTCDREARRLLGPRRGSAVTSPPLRLVVGHSEGKGVSAVVKSLLPRIREAEQDVASYHQRTVYEVHPELGFYQLNGDRPMRYPKATVAGIEERMALLQDKLNGLDRVLDNRPPGVALPRLLDACIDLWTARRIAAHAVTRLPEAPEWNVDGMKMEMVR
jgi:predicted RNase H-like nuclease